MIKALAAIFIGLIVYYVGYFLYKAYNKSQEKKKKEQNEQNYQTFIDESVVQEQEKKKIIVDLDSEFSKLKGETKNEEATQQEDKELQKQVVAQLIFRIKDLEKANKELAAELETQPKESPNKKEESLYQSGKNLSEFFSTGIDQITSKRSQELANFSFSN